MSYEETVVEFDGGAKNVEMEMFLAHLPANTPVYCYHNQQNLETLPGPSSDTIGDHFILVKNAPPSVLNESDEALPGQIDYSPSLQLLILKMPSLPQKEATT